jgi:hypothetical protein
MSAHMSMRAVSLHQEALDEIMRNLEPIYQAPAGTHIRLTVQMRKGGLKGFGLQVNDGLGLGSFLESLKTGETESQTVPSRPTQSEFTELFSSPGPPL